MRVKDRVPLLSAEHRITRDAEAGTDARTVLAVTPLLCIMDALHVLAQYHGTGELHEHEYLRLVAQ